MEVQLGLESDLEIQLISDTLAVGDQLVLNPAEDLTEGMAVMVNAV